MLVQAAKVDTYQGEVLNIESPGHFLGKPQIGHIVFAFQRGPHLFPPTHLKVALTSHGIRRNGAKYQWMPS